MSLPPEPKKAPLLGGCCNKLLGSLLVKLLKTDELAALGTVTSRELTMLVSTGLPLLVAEADAG